MNETKKASKRSAIWQFIRFCYIVFVAFLTLIYLVGKLSQGTTKHTNTATTTAEVQAEPQSGVQTIPQGTVQAQPEVISKAQTGNIQTASQPQPTHNNKTNSSGPMGLALGEVDKTTILKSFPNAKFSENGINKWTGGPMMYASGAYFDIDDLQDVQFIFDQNERLQCVIMRFPKGDIKKENFDKIKNIMDRKYKLVQQQIPYVGDKYARYEFNDMIVELNAPHLSFTMEVTYSTKAFRDSYLKQAAAEQSQHNQNQLSKF